MSKWNKSINGIMQNFALVSQVGIMMLVPILGGVVIGNFLDNKLGTQAIFLIIFIILGVGTSFRNLYTLAKQKINEVSKDETPGTYVNKLEQLARHNDNTEGVDNTGSNSQNIQKKRKK